MCEEKYQWFGEMLIKAFKNRPDFGFAYITARCGAECRVEIWFNDLKIVTGIVLERIGGERPLNLNKAPFRHLKAKRHIKQIQQLVSKKEAA